MKYLFLLLILTVICFGQNSVSLNKGTGDATLIEITRIGGCEYVIARTLQGGVAIVHHAACSNNNNRFHFSR